MVMENVAMEMVVILITKKRKNIVTLKPNIKEKLCVGGGGSVSNGM